MSLRRSLLACSCLFAAALALAPRFAPAGEPTQDPAQDRTLSPYFAIEGAADGIARLPLESTNADVRIAGVIADVVVTQAYRNDGTRPINARYVFPASTRAAVYGMKMTIGQRVIEARIREREAARAEYEEARKSGKTASLLEEDRPNVFSMNVANILPGDHIQVELRYTELLVPTAGVYELVYPTVVGPRYASGSADPPAAENRFVSSPYRPEGQEVPYRFGLKVRLAAGMPIQSLESPSHAIRTQFATGRASAAVELDPGETGGGDRDFVLRYRLSGPELATGLLLFPGGPSAPGAAGKDDSEGFFLMMVQPPARPAPDAIPPREYVFIVDVSGSMNGFPLDVSKQLMRDLLGRMRPTDRFDVLLFAGGSSLYAERSVEATPAQIDGAIAFIGAQQGGGGTELLPALQRAMSLPRPAPGVARSFVVITDGYIAEEAAMFQQVREHLHDASVFAFGIGSSVNRHLIEGLARAGQGEPFVALDSAGAAEAAAHFRAYVESPVLTGVTVAYDGFDVHDAAPVALADVFAERPVVLFGKWRGPARGRITLTGISGRGRFVNTIDVGSVSPDPANHALAQLWARTRIADLSDDGQGDANRDAVVALGLKYNLLTRFTSFIAVHQEVRASGQATDVDQPLPLPAGVSDQAIGVESGAEPPLSILLAFVALALAVAWSARRRRTRGGLA
jgi:Ca-activated chloride channel homolog